jgi:hypothetical protein
LSLASKSIRLNTGVSECDPSPLQYCTAACRVLSNRDCTCPNRAAAWTNSSELNFFLFRLRTLYPRPHPECARIARGTEAVLRTGQMEKVSTRSITSTSDDDSGDGTSPSLSYRSKQTSPHRSKIAQEANKFEFIDIDDKDGTRRAKSHAVKEFKRRKKAEGARFQRLKESSSRQLIAAAPANTAVPPPAITILDVVGRVVDPFNQFPTKLDSEKDLGLVHHCK